MEDQFLMHLTYTSEDRARPVQEIDLHRMKITYDHVSSMAEPLP